MSPSSSVLTSGRETRRASTSVQGLLLYRILPISIVLLVLLIGLALGVTPAQAQTVPTPAPGSDAPVEAPEEVSVEPTVRDDQIQTRLNDILDATGWFTNPQVRVEDGVVFLEGTSDSEEYKTWAGDLARNTQDVAAVVNKIEIAKPSIWDFTPAFNGLRELWFGFIRSIPITGFSLVVLLVTWIVVLLSMRATRSSLRNRDLNPLLINVITRSVGVGVFLIGLFVVFQVAGLTNIALTILGGTGLLGVILGIAFQDITENFLASIFLSVQSPFQTGDQVEITGIQGFVQALTTRATLLMTVNGDYVYIPNATVYKNNIYNYSINPNRRADFIIGIGYDDPISEAQQVALRVLQEHPAVLKDPEPWVLVEDLGTSTVNLHIYYWINGMEYSWLKVKSSIIRLVKRAFQQAGISMPDQAREMIFPDGIQVLMTEGENGRKPAAGSPADRYKPSDEEPVEVSTAAEAGLSSDAGEIKEQARRSRQRDEGENLLEAG